MFMPRALASLVDTVARQSVGKDWSLYAAMLDHWQEIVGQEYAQLTTPVKITFPHQPLERQRRGGTLYIRLPKGLAMEFTFRSEQIKQRVNTYFGCDVVEKIALDPVFGEVPSTSSSKMPADPLAVASVKEAAKSVENDDLRSALQSFGLAVMGVSNDDMQKMEQGMDAKESKR